MISAAGVAFNLMPDILGAYRDFEIRKVFFEAANHAEDRLKTAPYYSFRVAGKKNFENNWAI
jgi:hypothetical protein